MTSNYPNGFANGVSIRGIPVLNTHAGKVLWVDSNTGSNQNKGTRERPLATLDYAIGLCDSNKGDTIMIKPGHSETITGAGGIAADVAGIRIVGLGSYSNRPRFLMDAATTVTFAISAANVLVQNIVLAAGHADIVTAMTVTAAGAQILDVDFVDNVANENFLTAIKATSTTDNNADGLTVRGCRFMTPDTATLEFIEINANVDAMVLKDNFVCVKGTASPFVLSAGTKIFTNCLIDNNKIQNANTANDLFIDNGGSTGQTGIVSNNYVGNLDVTGAQTFGAATGLQFFENYSTSTSTEAGALAQAADTPLS